MAERKDQQPEQKQKEQREAADRESARLPNTVVAQAAGAQGDADKNFNIAFRSRVPDPEQKDLWDAIRLHTEQIGFNHFTEFIKRAFCEPDSANSEEFKRLGQFDFHGRYGRDCQPTTGGPAGLGLFAGFIPGVDLYGGLKLAAEIFLLLRCGICRVKEPAAGGTPADGGVFGIHDSPLSTKELDDLNIVLTNFLGTDRGGHINSIVRNVFGGGPPFTVSPFCTASIGLGPCLMELIWSYWHEQGMLVQTTNAIALRFQNVARGGRDPLAEFELDPLRPLSGFLWGYVRDEPTRLSVARRAYEYEHEYGLTLVGRAAARVRPADSRSKFLQAFHDLLRLTDQFYREASDNTVTPDAFPLLIALRDLHMILAEGAHNQFRDLPWTARSEMLVQQWLLAREETRDFLRGRLMTPYPEGWMGAVDAMKRLQGWSDTSVKHFSDLAKLGERLLLSVRHVRWDAIADPFAAHDWALVWRPEIQGYIHAYRMVTGIMLSDDVVELNRPDSPRYLQPSLLLRNRLLQQRRGLALPEATTPRRLALPARTRLLPRP